MRAAEKTGLAHQAEKVPFHVAESAVPDRRAGHQHERQRGGEVVLVLAEGFAHETTGTGSDDGGADFTAGDHAQFRAPTLREACPVGNQAAFDRPAALLAHPGKLAGLLKAHGAGKPQARRSIVRHPVKSDGGQAFAADPAAVGKDGAAALAGVAGEKAVLAFATDLGRLILAFHVRSLTNTRAGATRSVAKTDEAVASRSVAEGGG